MFPFNSFFWRTIVPNVPMRGVMGDSCPQARGYGGQLSPKRGVMGDSCPPSEGLWGQLSPKRGVMGTTVPQAVPQAIKYCVLSKKSIIHVY